MTEQSMNIYRNPRSIDTRLTRGSADVPSTLVRVTAPHFVAGPVVENNICILAAPILRWALARAVASLPISLC